MIKVDTIRIEEFRGIRDITLSLSGNNFAVCGPNGTGKSGVVDALEFVLTGNISRLSGRGTDSITLKDHAPHVDCRNAPEKARVTVSARISKTGRSFTITRTVKAPNSPTITPSDPQTIAVLKDLQQHPEFVLTRRELIKYVLSPPGERAKEVQALLRLDRVESARELLQKVANRCQKAAESADKDKSGKQESLRLALGITKLTVPEMLTAANVQRIILGLPAILELTASTSLKDGLLVAASTTSVSRIPKAQATADFVQLRAILTELASPATQADFAEARERLGALAANERLLNKLNRENFFRNALAFIDGDACPLCDDEWDPALLRQKIDAKLARLQDALAKRKEAETKLQPIVRRISALRAAIDLVLRHGAHITPPLDLQPLRDHRTSLESAVKQLEQLLPLAQTVSVLDTFNPTPATTSVVIADIEKNVAAIPEPTSQDAAKDFLSVAQERLEGFRVSALAAKTARAQAELTKRTVELYGTVSTTVLNDIYKVVGTEFTEFYRHINSTDEDSFTARLTPSLGKLGFDVDFYGRGHFPPGAYHSEGHQDGMGLCLYLALMRHLLKEDFTFAVLDDVLMSVDTAHRREVCSLLKKHFPDTQFILTTHDEIWLRHMKAVGIITGKAAAHFRTWDVDQGPVRWDDRNVWDELDKHLAQNDVRDAAALLRHYLEYISGELCRRLRARVEYRGDGQMQLGEILPPAINQLKDLYKRGKKAANSWNRQDAVAAIDQRETTLIEAATRVNVEAWQINPAVHFNEWATLSKDDFVPVVSAHKALIDAFRCESCQGFLYAMPDRGSKPESIRCECNAVSISTVEKA